MYGIIGLGGKCYISDLICGLIPDKYYAVAADSGIIYFELLGIRPDLLVGDMDSIPPETLAKYLNSGLPIIKFNPVKNMTDSEIAVEKTLDAGCDTLIFVGAFGDRLDHMFANQMMAVSLAEKGIPVILTDGISFFYTITRSNSPFKYPLSAIDSENDVISVILAKGDIANITIEGLEYELQNESIVFGTTRAVSNLKKITQNIGESSLIEENAVITIDSGVAFFIHAKNNSIENSNSKNVSHQKDESFGEEETFIEEIGNTITHGVMALIVLLMIPFATIRAFQTGGTNAIVDVIGVSIFMICIFLMFATSASYHSTKHKTTHKVIYNKLDHIAIFLAIAGTYTPIALSVIGGLQGIIMVVIQWSMVLTGIFIKIFLWRKSRILSVPVYLVMGWSVVLFFNTFRINATPELFRLVFAGGVFYSLGCIFYACKFRFTHMIFHFFINAGAALHFVGIVFFLSK